MNKTTKYQNKVVQGLMDTPTLMEFCGCGRATAVKIGEIACAKIKIGHRVLYNVDKIQKYLDSISEA